MGSDGTAAREYRPGAAATYDPDAKPIGVSITLPLEVEGVWEEVSRLDRHVE